MKIKIAVPEGIDTSMEENALTVKGEKGELRRVFKHHSVSMALKDGIVLETATDRRKDRAVLGTWKAHVKNMFKGASEGYTYKMKIIYVHFPMTVKVEGDKVVVNNFMGEKGQRIAKIIGDTQITVKKEDIEITGIDKDAAGQTAANIEKACKKKKKDLRVFHDGIYIIQKG